MIMKQKMISKMYLKGGQTGSEIDQNEFELDLMQNDKL